MKEREGSFVNTWKDGIYLSIYSVPFPSINAKNFLRQSYHKSTMLILPHSIRCPPY